MNNIRTERLPQYQIIVDTLFILQDATINCRVHEGAYILRHMINRLKEERQAIIDANRQA
jgi:hypothetical protein